MKRLLFLLLCIALSSCTTARIAKGQTLDQTYLDMYNPLLSGASCTNVTLASAITAVGAAQKTIYLTATDRAKVDCVWNITADVVVPSNVNIHVPFGVVVNVASGATLTFNGPVTIESPDSITGDGSYVFAYPQDAISRSYVIQDCLSTIPVSSLTLPAFQCMAKIRYGNKSFEVRQDSAAIGPITSTTGIYWVGMHWNTTSTVAGWTRQTGTKYLWRNLVDTDAPDTPDGMVLIMRVAVASSVIGLVGDIRPDTPTEGPVNASSPLFNVARDCATDDTVALQKVFNNAMWRSVTQVVMPPGQIRDCYRAPGGLWLTYHSTLNYNHPGNPLNLTGLVWDGHIEIIGSGSQFFSSLNLDVGGSGTVIDGTTGPVFRAISEYNVNGSKNITLRNLTVKGTATDPAVFLIDFDATAGVSLYNVAVKQHNHGGSGVRLLNYDRADINRLIIDGPDTWNKDLAAGSKALVMAGIDVDNSGSSVSALHIRSFDRAFELGNTASGETEATAHSTYGPITILGCNTCVHISGVVTHSVFTALQVNSAYDLGLAIGYGARNITFLGGAISGAADPSSNVYLGIDGTQVNNIVLDNVDLVHIFDNGVTINSASSLSGNIVIQNSRFHCSGDGNEAMVNFVSAGVKGGRFINNYTNTCDNLYGGVGTIAGFDFSTTVDTSAPEFLVKERLRIGNVVGALSGFAGIWSKSQNIDFGVVPASDCTAWVPFALTGVNVNNFIWPVKRPSNLPAKVIVEGDITDDDEVSVRLCNVDDADSADPPAADYDVVVLRVGE